MKLYDFAEEKESEVRQELRRVVGNLPAVGELTVFIDVAAPEVRFPEVEYRKVTVDPRGGGGYSVKPGNVRFRLGALLEALAGGTLTVAGALASPWLVPLGVLSVCASLNRAAKVRVGEIEAAVLLSIYTEVTASGFCTQVGLVERVNAELVANGRSHISDGRLHEAIAILMKLNCIGYALGSTDKLTVLETVDIKYGL